MCPCALPWINCTLVKFIPYICKVLAKVFRMSVKFMRVTYWITAVSFSAMMALSALLYLTAAGRFF